MDTVPRDYPHDEQRTQAPMEQPTQWGGPPARDAVGGARRKPRWLWWVMGGSAVALALAAAVAVGFAVVPALAAEGAAQRNPLVSFFGGAAGLGGQPGRAGRAELTVQKVSGGTITATRANGRAVTIHTTSSTTYWRAGARVDASAVASGERIAVRGSRGSDSSVTATRVEIVLPTYAGKVTAIKGSDLTVQGRGGQSHTVHTTGSTKVTRAGASASVGDIAVGDAIVATGTLNSDQTLTAEAIRVAQPVVAGQITAINGSDVVVRDADGGTLTIHTSGSTMFYRLSRGQGGAQKTTITLGNLAVGDRIRAEGTRAADGSLNASEVAVVPPGAGHGSTRPGGQPTGQPTNTAA